MEKDFWAWHILKSGINKSSFRPLFHEREIWWCSLGLNVGSEEDGKNYLFERPVVILRKFNREVFWGLPMTSRIRNDKYNFPCMHNGGESSVILSQIRLWDAKRLMRKIGMLPTKAFLDVNERFEKLLKNETALAGGISEAEAIVDLS